MDTFMECLVRVKRFREFNIKCSFFKSTSPKEYGEYLNSKKRVKK